jgi:hypothetical protein
MRHATVNNIHWFAACTGRQDHLQLMQNVDTLHKSRKDAEEERKQRVADDEIQRDNQKWSRNGWHDEENEPINYMEVHEPDVSLDAVSVGKYLAYNNPMINSFSIHSFVTSALSAACTYGSFNEKNIQRVTCFIN